MSQPERSSNHFPFLAFMVILSFFIVVLMALREPISCIDSDGIWDGARGVCLK